MPLDNWSPSPPENKEVQKEPWDYDAFVMYHDEYADAHHLRRYKKDSTTPHFETLYSKAKHHTTVKSFAIARCQHEQAVDEPLPKYMKD